VGSVTAAKKYIRRGSRGAEDAERASRDKAPPHPAHALLAALAEALRASRPMGRRPSTCKHVAGRPPIGRDGPGLNILLLVSVPGQAKDSASRWVGGAPVNSTDRLAQHGGFRPRRFAENVGMSRLPDEGLGVGVMPGEVLVDGRLQFVHAAEDPSAEAILGNVSE
jgi:hypothetical protein